jgi:hypothetical protein
MPPRDHFEGSREQVAVLFDEMHHVSDRVAAVSCASFVDDTLGAAIAARFVRLGRQWEKKVFSGADAPLGTLSAKIRLGFALGLYGPRTCADLDIIRSVRNDFAHTAGPILFTDPEIKAKCRRFTTPQRLTMGLATPFIGQTGPKALYVQTAQQISSYLIGAIRAVPLQRPSFPDALS